MTTKAENDAERKRLEADLATTKENRDLHPSPETREAYKAAWNALSAFVHKTEPMKTGSYVCRAGKRQAAEMRALYPRRR